MTTLPPEVEDSIQIENVVTSSDIGCNLDLAPLAADIPNAQYDASQFPGLVYRSNDPKVTILVFRSGQIVCTGSRSVDRSRTALDRLLGSFDDLGIEYDDPTISVQNIVGVANVDTPLNLNAIAIAFGLENTEYEPEQFPGLVYRLENHPTVALLFGSGKMVVTGGKSTEHVEESVEHVYGDLENFSLL